MAKAHLTLPNGTRVTIEGTSDEVQRLLGLAGTKLSDKRKPSPPRRTASRTYAKEGGKESEHPDLTELVNSVKDCDEADAIEKNILDRTSIVDRVLLPLYVLKKYSDSIDGLTSGEIGRVTKELGVPISQPNASTALSGAASKYVMGNKTRRKGQPVRYRLSRRGEQYIGDVIRGKAGED
jgi:hypothetical protein